MSYGINDICILGTGGVGGYFGGVMAHRLAGAADGTRMVHFIARGAHLEKIRESGLILRSEAKGNLTCVPATATDDITRIPQPDLCLLCVKGYDLEGALAALRAHMKPGTIVMPLLNGADIYERVRSGLPEGTVLPSCVYVGAFIEAPGVVRQHGAEGIVISGNEPGRRFDPAPLASLFAEAGIPLRWHEDPFPAIWEKYLFIASFGLVSARTDRSLGEILDDAASLDLARGIMEEIVSVARAKGIRLAGDIIPLTLKKARRFPHDLRTSYQRDVESKGARNEGDLFGGTILRLGQSLGVAVPLTRSVYAEILRRTG